jgi:hypothetical protein
VNGHDLTDEENVKVVRRGKYVERQCKPCQQERAREWWRKNRGKKGNDDAST